MSPEASDPLLLLGGSFDPIHNGHLRAALDAAALLGAASTTLLPAAMPALRDPLSASAEQRLAMLKLAVGDDPMLRIDDRELRRGGRTYTVDTLRSLRQQWPERSIVFLLGADAFTRLPHWRDWQSLLQLAHLGVLTRPGQDLQAPATADFRAARRDTASALAERPGGHWMPIEVTPLAISATRIRALLAQRRSARFLLPDAVLDYIARAGIYADAAPGSEPR